MRPPSRALETREDDVDPPTATIDTPWNAAESRIPGPIEGQMLRRGLNTPAAKADNVIQGHRLERRIPFRTPGKIDKPLR